MLLRIRLFGPLERYGRAKGWHSIELSEPVSLDDLIRLLGAPPSSIGFIAVNGEKQPGGCLLQEGDEVWIYPPVSGG